MRYNQPPSIKPAILISGLYLLIGVSWIYLSDRIPLLFGVSIEEEVLIQTMKGWFFILATSVLLFVLINQQIKKRNKLINLLTSDNLLLNEILNKSTDFSIFVADKQRNVILNKGEAIKTIKGGKKLEDHFSDTITNFFNNLWEIKQASLQEIQISEKWYEVYGSILKDETEETELALLMFKDITLQKKAERVLEKSRDYINRLQTETEHREKTHEVLEKRYILIKENLYNGVILTSINATGQPSNILEVNKATREILNLQGQEVTLGEISEILKKQNSGKEHHLFKNNYQTDRQLIEHLEITTPHQSSRNIEITGRYLEAGSEQYILYILRDIPKYQTYSFDNLSIDYKNLLNYLSIGLMLFQEDGNCFYINNSMKELLGIEVPAEGMLSPEDIEVLGQDIHLKEHLKKSLEGTIVRVPVHKINKQSNRYYESVFLPIENTTPTPSYVIRIVKEITPLIEQEQEIKALRSELGEQSMLKNVLLMNLSHEIRTPMNSISGFLEILSLETLTPVQTEYLQYIKQNSESLFKILNSLIELSQLENKSIVVQKGWFKTNELAEAIKDLGHQYVSSKEDQKVVFTIHVTEEIYTDDIYSDKEKILTIVEKILDNAFKFTEEGHIEVTIGTTTNNQLEIKTKDTGCGIKTHNLKNIYIPFATFRNQSEVIFGGLGLGLPIAKRYTDLLGGTIEVESTERVGSEFIVKIPGGLLEKKIEEEPSLIPVKKILIIQYSSDGIDEIQAQFKQYEAEVIYSSSGAEALEIILDQPDIDLIIADIYLPDMKIIELLTALRRMKTNIPVIAQTALFINEEHTKYLQAGFDDYIQKPIKTSQVFRLVTK